MHCAPPSKRHALCNAIGRGGTLRGAVMPQSRSRRGHLCACLRPASNNPVTNNSANASFLDMPRAHTRIRISTPHVGVLITFLELAHRHFGTASTRQRTNVCLRLACASRNAGQVSRPQAHCLGSKPRQPQRAPATVSTVTSPTDRRSTSRDRPNSPPRRQANVHNRPLKEGSE